MSKIVYDADGVTYTGEYNDQLYLLNTLLNYGLTAAVMSMMIDGDKSEVQIEEEIKSDIVKNIDIDAFKISNNWNESVKKIQEQIDNLRKLKFFGCMSIDDIAHGDAGERFSGAENFVKPWNNASGDSYYKVRNSDAYNGRQPDLDLMDANNLDFTNPKRSDYLYLRLLMPQYERIVKIEDLDRNFWVISQVLSGISSFLFGPNGLGEIFKNLILEIAHLWSNVALLWLAAEGNDDTDIDTYYEFATLNNQGFFHMNYDSYSPGDKLDQRVQELFTAVKEAHPKSNIGLLIEIRDSHYWDNCYSKVSYKLCMFDRLSGKQWIRDICFNKGKVDSNDDSQTDMKFVISDDDIIEKIENGETEEFSVKGFYFRSSDFTRIITGYKKIGTKYSFRYPFSSLSNLTEEWDYQLGVRIVPYLHINFSSTPERFGFKPMVTLAFELHDIGQEMYTGENAYVYTYQYHDIESTEDQNFIEISGGLIPAAENRPELQDEGYSQYGSFSGENLTGIYLDTLTSLTCELIQLPMPGFTNTAIQKVDSNEKPIIPIELDFPKYIDDNPSIFGNTGNILREISNFLSSLSEITSDELKYKKDEMPNELNNLILTEEEVESDDGEIVNQIVLKSIKEVPDILIITCTYPYRLWHSNSGAPMLDGEHNYNCYDYKNSKIEKIKIKNGLKKGKLIEDNIYTTDTDGDNLPLNFNMSDLGHGLLVCRKNKKEGGKYSYDCARIDDYYYVSTLPEEMIQRRNFNSDSILKHGIYTYQQPMLFQDPSNEKNWLIKWVRFSGATIGFQWGEPQYVWYADCTGSNHRNAIVETGSGLQILTHKNEPSGTQEIRLFTSKNNNVSDSDPKYTTIEKFPTPTDGGGTIYQQAIIGRVQTNYIHYHFNEATNKYVTDWSARMQSRNTDLYERYYTQDNSLVRDGTAPSSATLWAPGESLYEYPDQCLKWHDSLYLKNGGEYKSGKWRLFGTWYLKQGANQISSSNTKVNTGYSDMENLIDKQYILTSQLPKYDYSIDPTTGNRG